MKEYVRCFQADYYSVFLSVLGSVINEPNRCGCS